MPKWNFFSLTVKQLEEDEIYTFQVYSLSANDYEAGSNEYELLIPPYRRIKAIVIGSVSGLIFILAAVFTLLYMKRRCLHNFKQVECNDKM
jgi:immunoglobulin superfamily member 9B